MKRRKSAEIAQGYPGFPYHHTTTEDYTMVGHRFVLRPIKELPGQYVVHMYVCDVPKVVRINGHATSWLGRKLEKWGFL